jgi:hypothetical protein
MNPTKLCLHFSKFFKIFYAIYKILQNDNTIGDPLLHRGPWKGSGSYKYTLTLWISPQKELRSCNVVLGAVAGAGGAIPASSGVGVGQESCARRPAAAAAAVQAPAWGAARWCG